jgi:hypothetical protein
VDGDAFALAPTGPATVTFLGEWGETLAEERTTTSPGPARDVVYRLSGGESLVRARVMDAAGRHAWTAAYRVVD